MLLLIVDADEFAEMLHQTEVSPMAVGRSFKIIYPSYGVEEKKKDTSNLNQNTPVNKHVCC